MWNSDEELNSLLENSKDLLTIDKIELEWENINLIAKSSEGSIKILENLSGSARPGEITVIMGESGSGKSSLLSILSATIDLQSDLEVFGSIKLNGEDLNEVNRSKYIRFLDQEFILHESMTAYEFLYFQLKLRKNNPNDIIEKKINLILQRFGLTNVASCPIGGKLFRGLSGGERRRVAIAGELICSPSVLILDEPTSGLDSTLAKTVVGCLKEICQSGVTVLITIHQPGFEIFSMIDKLILIQKGCFLYQGTASESLNYFSSLGFEVPKLINPPDFYMQVIHIQDKNHLTEKELDTMMKLKNAYEFQKSTLMGHSFIRLETLNEVDEAPASFLSIVKLLIWREIISLKRNPIQCKIRVVQLIFYSFMNALLYQDLGLDSEGIENRRGFIIRVLTTCLIISVYTLALTISHERKIIIKEIQDNLYTVQSYLTFKILTEIPAAIITCILMSIAPYHFVNMNHEHDYKMWVFFLVILNCYFQGIIIGCLAGAISQNPVFVMTFSSVLINVAYVFSGVYTNPEAGPEVTAWLRFLSPILFLRDAAMKNEYQDLDYDDDIYPSPQEKFKYHREVSKNLLISLIHFVCNYLLACIFLRASLKKFTALKEKS